MTDLRSAALDLFQAAVDRADPRAAVGAHLESSPLAPLPQGARRYIVAIGKAAVPMLSAALEILPPPHKALAITNPENIAEIPTAEVHVGSHPVPDHNSATAGARMLELMSETRPGDQVLALISGGGSALMVAPAAPLTLEDKSAANQLLLESGLDIVQMNLVRQQLSALKGGGLLRAASPAKVTALILSDVIGDDLRAIASGPTVSPLGTRAEARAILKNANLWHRLPNAVQTHLAAPDPVTETPQAINHLIGSNRQSLDAMQTRAQALGYEARIASDALVGDVSDACAEVEAAVTAPTDRPLALLFGGETTVQLSGTGRGGRNQELALRIARALSDAYCAAPLEGDWVFLSGGTDGRDGPTDAAGGIVTAETWAAIGPDAQALLDNNDSHAALNAANALLMTGGTGTNVADVQILLRAPKA